MKKYIIGIDTGGTYTDGVLVNLQSGQIVAIAKKATTHFQLATGIAETLAELLEVSKVNPAQIEKIAISSTLATNSVVENRGARVAILVIGYVKHFQLPVKAVLFIKGGHTITGNEEEPLDLNYLVELIHGLKNEVDAYGICSAMSMKNPAHELVAEKAIAMIDPKPVFCSHRISDLAGMEERAATAGLHAKLMPIMQEFVTEVKRALKKEHLNCPVAIVGGNGKLIDDHIAVAEAGLTIASGPACSAHFGAGQTDGDCLVVDIGGTTTDITMIEDGTSRLASDGCQIGRWKTHVEAIDMHTAGIGGDSHVQVNKNGEITLGPRRVTPLAMMTSVPTVINWLGDSDHSRLIVRHPQIQQHLSDELTDLLFQPEWSTVAMIKKKTGLGGIALEKKLEQLSRNLLIYECGFTPTDALHALDLLHIGNREESYKGAEILGEAAGMSADNFCRTIISMTEEKIENLIINYVIQKSWGKSLTGFVAARKNHLTLGVSFSVKIPIIGIGAAARYFLPQAAKNLGTTVSFPDNCEVGNAIGAALLLNS